MGHDGRTHTRVSISPTMSTHTNDISVQFKTTDDGLLLTTSNHVNDGYLKLYLSNGEGVIETNIDRQPVIIITSTVSEGD